MIQLHTKHRQLTITVKAEREREIEREGTIGRRGRRVERYLLLSSGSEFNRIEGTDALRIVATASAARDLHNEAGRHTGQACFPPSPVVKSENFGRLFELSLHYLSVVLAKKEGRRVLNLLTIANANTRQHGDLQHIRMTTMVTNASACL